MGGMPRKNPTGGIRHSSLDTGRPTTASMPQGLDMLGESFRLSRTCANLHQPGQPRHRGVDTEALDNPAATERMQGPDDPACNPGKEMCRDQHSGPCQARTKPEGSGRSRPLACGSAVPTCTKPSRCSSAAKPRASRTLGSKALGPLTQMAP